MSYAKVRKSYSIGSLWPKHFLGRWLSHNSILSISSLLTIPKSVPFDKDRLTKPIVKRLFLSTNTFMAAKLFRETMLSASQSPIRSLFVAASGRWLIGFLFGICVFLCFRLYPRLLRFLYWRTR